ncbi:alpha-amylase [Prevotella sp. A2931]|uniref:Alpha-amylase n=1 Tax=Prevotella illustrans TaxID=2800387 RepID=A0ABS3M736_9BACT|nr:alpha-amylase family glycosyl hydrolase [Prevotella illustrans]MBO1363940.1 alpha-amylase [Prevotella illustrans]PTL25666.1 alpha-amylase [Prevotella sp. oral taxon 820]
MIIYQVIPRLFGNRCKRRMVGGSISQNGCGKLNDFNVETLKSIRDLGVTHLWFTGVVRHATTTDYSLFGLPNQHSEIVKGKAGSPYAIVDYYDVDPDLATDVSKRMGEWEETIQRTHQVGMKVIMDFVPNHVAREYHSIAKPSDVEDLGEGDDSNLHFSLNNNFYYCWGKALDLRQIVDHQHYEECPAKATGNDYFDNNPGKCDWYETVKLNYGIDYCGGHRKAFSDNLIPDTWLKMLDILLFWAKKGIDGFRCDMAEMVPSEFWTFAITRLKFEYPNIIFIGEVYAPDQYRKYIASGFDFLYDKVGMYDCLRGVITGTRPTKDITAQWQATNDITDHMLFFLENHDEQRIASDFFAGDPWRAIPAHIICCLLATNPYMLYAGQEFGEKGMDSEGFSGCDGRTTIFDYWSIGTLQRGYLRLGKPLSSEALLKEKYQQIMHISENEKAVKEGRFFDLMYVNPTLGQHQFAWLRKAENDVLLIVVNFSDQAAQVEVMVPRHAFDVLDLTPGTYHGHDLLSDEIMSLHIDSNAEIPLKLKPNDGVVIKWVQ